MLNVNRSLFNFKVEILVFNNKVYFVFSNVFIVFKREVYVYIVSFFLLNGGFLYEVVFLLLEGIEFRIIF